MSEKIKNTSVVPSESYEQETLFKWMELQMTYHGLFIEMKRQKGGKVSDAQKAWISALIDQGYLAVVCYGWKDAAELIEDYLEER